MDMHSAVPHGSSSGINQENVMRGLTPRNVSPQKYKVDEKVETYADVIRKRLNEVTLRGGSKRFVNFNIVSDSVDKLACGECAKEEVGKTEDNVMTQF